MMETLNKHKVERQKLEDTTKKHEAQRQSNMKQNLSTHEKKPKKNSKLQDP